MGKPAKANAFSNLKAGALGQNTLVIDNGAHSIKAGFSSANAEPDVDKDCHLIPNCIARSQRDKRTYIGAELDECVDFGELAFRRPVEKGFVVNWEGEKAIWEHSFLRNGAALQCEPRETNLLLAEAPNCPSALQRNMDEMIFEEFEFANYYRTLAPVLNAYAPSPITSTPLQSAGTPLECLLVVDVGHSYTTVTPLLNGRAFQHSIRRLEVGGKTLSNYLKSMISMRDMEMSKEDHMAGQLKEDCCFVSSAFKSDLEHTWKLDAPRFDHSIAVDYVMPDYETIKRGFARPHDPRFDRRKAHLGVEAPKEDILTLANERFTVPEILFTPSDIGMQQEGICDTILQSIHSLPEAIQPAFLANIAVVGGTSKLKGFMERLEGELRSQVSDSNIVRVARASDPVKNTWLGGSRMAANQEVMKSVVVSRQEYFENGLPWMQRKFSGKVDR